MKSVGSITLGVGSDKERTIQLTDFLRYEFVGNRIATVAKCEEGNYLLSIENTKKSDRQPRTEMYLTEGSFTALLFAALAFLHEKGVNLDEKIKEYSLRDDKIEFVYNTIDGEDAP